MILVNYFNVNNVSSKGYEYLLALLPRAMAEKICRYKKTGDRKRTVIGKWVLQNLLLQNNYPQDVLQSLQVDGYGRPYIDTDIDFNISHSGNFVVCVFSGCSRVGVDIEECLPIDWKEYRDFLTTGEVSVLKKSTNPVKLFYSIWTQKEAVAKANGKGLSLLPADVALEETSAMCENTMWAVKEIVIDDDYKCHLAYADSGAATGIRVSESDFLKRNADLIFVSYDKQ